MRKTEITFLLIASFLIGYSWLDGIVYTTKLDIQYIHLDSITKVILVNDSTITPVLYDSLIIQNYVSPDERKQQFINQVLPAILIVKYQIENKSKKVDRIMHKIEDGIPLKPREGIFVDSLMVRYRAKSYENLLIRMKPHATSLVLAQAAVESGWGSSRFAMEGNNLFGVWASSTDPNSIKSKYKRNENSIHVKKYLNVAESIDHYFLTLGRNNAYLNFRAERYAETNVFQLLESLDRYSERGDAYTQQLRKIIEWNNLQDFDRYSISSDYILDVTYLDYYRQQAIDKIKMYLKRLKSFLTTEQNVPS
ncbi:MAG: glucosaminidase domain-containing protein [Prolixibacteraceae bacterium]